MESGHDGVILLLGHPAGTGKAEGCFIPTQWVSRWEAGQVSVVVRPRPLGDGVEHLRGVGLGAQVSCRFWLEDGVFSFSPLLYLKARSSPQSSEIHGREGSEQEQAEGCSGVGSHDY